MSHTRNPFEVIILAGPTASGKSALGMLIAKSQAAVIINADSKQIYCDIPIITAQPTAEDQLEIEHRLYGTTPLTHAGTVTDWLDSVITEIKNVWKQGKIPLLIGGTGLYIKSLMHGIAQVPPVPPSLREELQQRREDEGLPAIYEELMRCDPLMAKRLAPADAPRILRALEVIKATGDSLAIWQQKPLIPQLSEASFRLFFLDHPRNILYERCNTRFDSMFEQGLMQEMEALHRMNLSPNLPAMRAHGVPEMMSYLNGTLSKEEAVEIAKRNTRHYIKRQLTWQRHQMKDAQVIHSIEDYNRIF